jgi:hypothetical protein
VLELAHDDGRQVALPRAPHKRRSVACVSSLMEGERIWGASSSAARSAMLVRDHPRGFPPPRARREAAFFVANGVFGRATLRAQRRLTAGHAPIAKSEETARSSTPTRPSRYTSSKASTHLRTVEPYFVAPIETSKPCGSHAMRPSPTYSIVHLPIRHGHITSTSPPGSFLAFLPRRGEIPAQPRIQHFGATKYDATRRHSFDAGPAPRCRSHTLRSAGGLA